MAFHPITGRLWYDMAEHDYQSSDDVASRDPKAGLTSEERVAYHDRSNSDPVLAPDGKSFAFLSEGENGKTGLFRADFVPGGKPVKIADVEEPADAPRHMTYLLRWN